MAKSRATAAPIPPANDHYVQLVREFPLRPIKTAEAHQQAKKVMRGLIADKTPDATDYKIVLARLIADYEHTAKMQIDVSGVTPAAVVKHLLAQQDLSVNAFAKAQGISQSALSDMLNGRRDWSKSAIVVVADYFGLPRGMFLQ